VTSQKHFMPIKADFTHTSNSAALEHVSTSDYTTKFYSQMNKLPTTPHFPQTGVLSATPNNYIANCG